MADGQSGGSATVRAAADGDRILHHTICLADAGADYRTNSIACVGLREIDDPAADVQDGSGADVEISQCEASSVRGIAAGVGEIQVASFDIHRATAEVTPPRKIDRAAGDGEGAIEGVIPAVSSDVAEVPSAGVRAKRATGNQREGRTRGVAYFVDARGCGIAGFT